MKRRKSKLGNKIKQSIAIFFIAILLFYILTKVYSMIQQPNNIIIVENGKLFLEEETDGLIIRDEKVIQGSNYKNGMLQIKAEGQRVAKGEAVFRYYGLNEDSIKQKISDIETKIQEIMPEVIENDSSDIALLENQIKTQLQELYKISDLQKIEEYKADINTYILKKVEIMAQSSKNEEISNLVKQKRDYENELAKNSEYVNAPVSGVVSYRIDNLEEILKPNDFSYLSNQFFKDINIKTGQIIATSEEKGKIINNFESYIAVILNSEISKNAKIGDKVCLQLSNSKEINAEITYINPIENGERIIVFKVNKNIEELVKYRKISLNIIWWEYSGFKVPNNAIKIEGNKSYVNRNRTGYNDKILIKIEKQNENYSIVRNYNTDELHEQGYTKKEIDNMKKLELYDEIIIDKV